MTLDDLTKRVEELESQAAFQDELHERLNDIVARQDREILSLGQQLKALSEHLQDLRESAPASSGPADEIPPHY